VKNSGFEGLEEVVGATVVDPVRDERGWAFREGPGHGADPVEGFAFLKEAYLQDLYQQPGIAETVDFDHIKRHYYLTHHDINPTGIVPLGPDLDLGSPHGRERVGA